MPASQQPAPEPAVAEGGPVEQEMVPDAIRSGEAWAVAVPWEAWRAMGLLRAYYHTWRRLLVQPGRFFGELPLERPAWPALTFGATSFALGTAVLLLLVAWPDLPASAPAFLLLLTALPFIGLYRTLSSGLVLWLALGILAGRTPPWRGVLRLAGYGQGADLLLPLGGIGFYVAAWLHFKGLRAAFGEPLWRAALVALLPLVAFHLLVLGLLGIYLTVGGGVV